MASTYTSNSGVEKPGIGDQSGEWGTTVNTNMDILDRAINGVGVITLSGTTHTLTTTDGALSDGQYKVLVLSGSPSGTNTITISPNDQDKLYFVVNSSGQTATFSQGSGANVSVVNGDTKIIYADGAGSGAAVTEFASETDALEGITAGTVSASKAVIVDANKDITGFRNVTLTGELDAGSLDVSGNVDIDGTLETDALSIASTAVTSTAAELNLLDTATAGTTVNSKAVIYGSTGNITATDIAVSGSGSRAITITSSDGIGSMEIGAAAGSSAFIDLKTPSGDDFDLRLASESGGSGGFLQVASGNLTLSGSGKTSAVFDGDGAVTLYHDNAAKLATTATGVDVTGAATASTFEPDSDTAAGDNAAIGYTAAEGLILTGQGSTSDVTIKNDADAEVLAVPTGTTTGKFAGNVIIAGDDSTLFNAVGSTAKLVVTGSTSNTNTNANSDASIVISNTDQTAGNTSGLHFARADTDDTPNYAGASIVGQFPESQATGQYPKGLLAFLTSTAANNAPSEKMRIDADGNVGIGTTSTGDNKLTVEGGVAATNGSSLALKSGSGANSRVADLAFYGTFVTPDTDTGQRRTADITSGFSTANWGNEYLAFGVGTGGGNDSAAVTTERMRIAGNGKVGIGTTNPGAMLQVHSAALGTTAGDTQDILQLHSPDTSNNTVYKFLNYRHSNGSSHDESELRWQRKVDVTNQGYIGLRNEAITFGYGNNTELMRLRNNGQFLINSTSIIASDNAYLQVTGGSVTPVALRGGTNNYFMAFYKQSNNDLIGSITGSTGSTTSFNTSSDYRLKENVDYSWDATTRLKQLKPARFNFISDPDNTVDGFIAHEVQEVVPHAVTGVKDGEEMQGIDHSKLVPLLTASLQEALKRIDSLEEQVNALKGK